ncbi:MAG: o-succinylbenzoate synthase [Flavobacteriaceae bacterium]|nr:o-succinylbenzoate synthase [Flavobacteriaceae bacterium]
MKAHYKRYVLKFKRPGGTSRGVLTEKETWFLYLTEGNKIGVGECGLFRGLSADDRPDYEDQLKGLCDLINQNQRVSLASLQAFPSIQMGYETALLSLQTDDPYVLYPSEFIRGKKKIRINGLVWMGELSFMKTQIDEKIDQGFDCIKLKIGALDFDQELSLLRGIRKHYDSQQMMLRVDANGAFSPSEAPNKLKALSELDIHSIEQPIKAGQVDAMHQLCVNSPIPIALDEELIGVIDTKDRKALLDAIMPQYLILKPSLLGGFKSCEEWIRLAEDRSIGWWVTSALESNIGLNAIAQWTFSLGVNNHQGLGTGGLFTNNFESPLEVRQGYLTFNSNQNWEMPTV